MYIIDYPIFAGYKNIFMGKNKNQTILNMNVLTQLLILLVVVTSQVFISIPAHSANNPVYAAVTMDARNGKIVHSRKADQQLHPASLTKMMTLYITFQAVKDDELQLDDMVRISKNAANEPASKVYLQTGSKYSIRFLIRAAAIRSANDAATALAEAISGSEKAFVARMNRTAETMGLNRTNFKNAHGLTNVGHFSTARDMANLGRRLIYDYPDFYNLFSRRSTTIGSRTIYNTNRIFLNSFRGADGIKTGYTRAAGFNQVVSAKRGNVRLIVSMFGGSSAANRNKKVAELLENGFKKVPSNVKLVKPSFPLMIGDTTYARTLIGFGAPIQRPANFVSSWSSIIADIEVPVARQDANIEDTDYEVINVVLSGIKRETGIAIGKIEGDSEEGTETYAFSETETSQYTPIHRPNNFIQQLLNLGVIKSVGVSLGEFHTKHELVKRSTRVKLIDPANLVSAKQQIHKENNNFILKFTGMTMENAKNSCTRIRHRKLSCDVIYLN